jgi:hypothetical protein
VNHHLLRWFRASRKSLFVQYTDPIGSSQKKKPTPIGPCGSSTSSQIRSPKSKIKKKRRVAIDLQRADPIDRVFLRHQPPDPIASGENFFFLKPDHVGLQIRSLASLNKKKHASRPRPSAESVWGRARDRVPRRAEARRLSMVQRQFGPLLFRPKFELAKKNRKKGTCLHTPHL